MSDRKLGESHFARINSEKRKLNERSQGAKWKRKNHLAQDIGTFRYAGAQGGEVPGQLVKKMFFI